MTHEQATVLAILVGVLALFVWGRWRHDVVAVLALLAAVLAGVVPASDAFAGFGHPATITVAMVLIISRALQNAGVVDIVARRVRLAHTGVAQHLAGLTGLGAALSMVMNNVGALALLMPVALRSAREAERSPGTLLMPLSFGSILGGLVTMIGTPPNIIVATFRAKTAGAPFTMFDFTPVGGAVAVTGVAFVALIGWRLIPKARRQQLPSKELFDLEDYVFELIVPKESPAVGKTLGEIERESDGGAAVVGRGRRRRRGVAVGRREVVQADDRLVVEAGAEALAAFVDKWNLETAGGDEPKTGLLHGDDTALMEAAVPPRSRIEGRSVNDVRLTGRHGAVLLAVSRQGRPIRERLGTLTLEAGDVLLLQGDAERLPDVIAWLGCLPLAERELSLGRPRQAGLCAATFAAAIAAASFGLTTFPVALAVAAAAMVLTAIVPPRQIYESVDWPVIVLLGAMIPVGEALETSGATDLIAGTMLGLGDGLSPVVVMVLLMVVTMTLSDIMNNAATAVVMAPIAIGIAGRLDVASDPFLMTVAVAASCAFLTPIGHQNNLLVMGPGGYRFGDYWRLGLPLEILIVCVSIPMILWVWPL